MFSVFGGVQNPGIDEYIIMFPLFVTLIKRTEDGQENRFGKQANYEDYRLETCFSGFCDVFVLSIQ